MNAALQVAELLFALLVALAVIGSVEARERAARARKSRNHFGV